MRKIPTVFVRNETDRRYVTPEVTPGTEWVFDREGTPTRKYDGTCVMYDGAAWWARREVKPRKQPPANFVEVEHDETTGKTVGWEPAEQSGFWTFIEEGIEALGPYWWKGTYELCGPKVNRNPEGFAAHCLIRHDDAEVFLDVPLNYDQLRHWLLAHDFEGIVWHHPDGRMAKIKKRDFPGEGQSSGRTEDDG